MRGLRKDWCGRNERPCRRSTNVQLYQRVICEKGRRIWSAMGSTTGRCPRRTLKVRVPLRYNKQLAPRIDSGARSAGERRKRREGKKNERKSAGGGPRGMRAGRRRDERAQAARLLISEPGRDIRPLDYGVGTHCSGHLPDSQRRGARARLREPEQWVVAVVIRGPISGDMAS